MLLEWTDPPFAPGHWIPEMVELAGGTRGALFLVGDPKQAITNIISLTFDSKEEVIAHCEMAYSLGARKYKDASDLGFMYQQGFEDLDGNIWEGFWMDPAAVQG